MKIHITLADLSFIGPVLIVQNNRGSIVNWNRTPTARGFQRVDWCFWNHRIDWFNLKENLSSSFPSNVLLYFIFSEQCCVVLKRVREDKLMNIATEGILFHTVGAQ